MVNCVMTALWNDASFNTRLGDSCSQAISTARRPVATASRLCSATTAGMELECGNDIPMASAIHAIVDAVPIVMHVPADLAMQFSISFQSLSQRFPAHRSFQYFQASEPLPNVWSFQRALSIGPAGRKIEGISAEMAPISRAGTVLSQPPIKTAASIGWHRKTSSVSMASRFRYSMVVGFISISPKLITGISTGKPPACKIPRFTSSARCGKCEWQVLRSLQVFNNATIGLSR